jgi:hypothetical protein
MADRFVQLMSVVACTCVAHRGFLLAHKKITSPPVHVLVQMAKASADILRTMISRGKYFFTQNFFYDNFYIILKQKKQVFLT